MNLMFIAAMLLADRAGWDMGLTLAWTVPLTGIAQFAFTWYSARRQGFTLLPGIPRWTPELKRLLIIAGPAVLAGAWCRSTCWSGVRSLPTPRARSPG